MVIPGYSLIREISQGPVSRVLLCRQESLDREVLLKILHTKVSQDPEMVRRFTREARFYAHLKHPNIVDVFDLGQHEGAAYLAMEYIDGWSLTEVVARNQNIPVEIVLYVAKKLLTGLQYAHQKNIIHRDIKPGNILIGKDGSVKLADFGLARTINLTTVSNETGTFGTPAYMAPELIRGEKSGTQSDIFALGVSLYEMLTGESPFAGNNIAESIHKLLNRDARPVSQLRPDLPEWFADLLMNMVSRRPADRPDSCTEILNTIELHSKENPVLLLKQDFENYLRDPQTIHERVPFVPKILPVYKQNKSGWQRYSFILPVILAAIVVYLLVNWPEHMEQSEVASASPDSVNVNSPDSMPDLPFKAPAEPVERQHREVFEKDAGPAEAVIEKMPVIHTVVNRAPGDLFIAATPWAEIRINGVPRDTTPLSVPLRLAAGNYFVELLNPNSQVWSDSVRIRPGKVDSITVQLRSLIGFLKLHVFPWGKVFINEKYVDTTPLTDVLALISGRYLLHIENENYRSYDREIEITPGNTTDLTVYLEK